MHWVRDTSLSADGDRASAVETRSGRSTFLSPSSAHRQPRRRQHGWAQNARSIHDSWASRVETARISLKRMRRFRLAPRVGQNGTRPGFRAIQHGECALGALDVKSGTLVGVQLARRLRKRWYSAVPRQPVARSACSAPQPRQCVDPPPSAPLLQALTPRAPP